MEDWKEKAQKISESFFPEGPRVPGTPDSMRPTKATPERVGALLEDLASVTEDLREEASAAVADNYNEILEWDLALADWQRRLGHYRGLIEQVPPRDRDTAKGADRIFLDVSSPLLLGLWWHPAPGMPLGEVEAQQLKSGTPVKANLPDSLTPSVLESSLVQYQGIPAQAWNAVSKALDDAVDAVKEATSDWVPDSVRASGWKFVAKYGPGGASVAAAGASFLLAALAGYLWFQDRKVEALGASRERFALGPSRAQR